MALALRRALVIAVHEDGRVLDLQLLEGPLEGRRVPGLALFGASPQPGASVLANALGLEMGLGTGGVAFVVPDGSAAGEAPENQDHLVKLPYTPLQFPSPAPAMAGSLAGVPVVVLALHSHLAPACCAAAVLRPGVRVAFVWQEGGALAVAFSDTVRRLKEVGLLSSVVSSGSCFGGDVEAPNVYSGLLAAAGPSVRAGLVLCGIGPGIVGTATPYGHGGMSAAVALNAASALGTTPVYAPRVSAADTRERHRGLSHHSRAALEAALAGCRVVLPRGALETGDLADRHVYEHVSFGAAGLERRFGVTFSSMGRGYADDPVFFDAPAAAVALALGEGQ